MAADAGDRDHDSQLDDALRLFAEGISDVALEQLASLHAADQAEVVSRLDASVRGELLPRLSTESIALMLAHLREERRLEILEELPTAVLAPVLDLIDFDLSLIHISEPTRPY